MSHSKDTALLFCASSMVSVSATAVSIIYSRWCCTSGHTTDDDDTPPVWSCCTRFQETLLVRGVRSPLLKRSWYTFNSSAFGRAEFAHHIYVCTEESCTLRGGERVISLEVTLTFIYYIVIILLSVPTSAVIRRYGLYRNCTTIPCSRFVGPACYLAAVVLLSAAV